MNLTDLLEEGQPLLPARPQQRPLAPMHTVLPPDFGPEIKDAEKYIEELAKAKRIIIIADGHHYSAPTQAKINKAIIAAKPAAAAMEFNIGDEIITAANVIEKIRDFRKELKKDEKDTPENIELVNSYESRFQDIKDRKIPLEFPDNRTEQERSDLETAMTTLERLKEMEEKGQITADMKPRIDRQRKEALAEFNKINEKMEKNVAAVAKKLYDNTKGTIVIDVGSEHATKDVSIREQLVKLGVPKDQITVICIKPVQELPPKPMQKGGIGKVDATIFVKDTDNGHPTKDLGGVVVSEATVLTKEHLLRPIEEIRFTGRPDRGAPKYISLEIILDKKDERTGKLYLSDIALPGNDKPLARSIIIHYDSLDIRGPTDKVEIPIADLPMKQPGEKMTDAEKKQWTDRLQKGITELRQKIEAKEKAKDMKAPPKEEQPGKEPLGTFLSPQTPAAPPLPVKRER